jgi:hypothetical protein
MYSSRWFYKSFILVLFLITMPFISSFLFAQESEQILLITVESLPVRPGEPISIEFSSDSSNSKDWIGLYKSDASDRDYLEWQYLNGLSEGSLLFNPVAEEGAYQFRGFADDGMNLLGKSEIFEIKKIKVEVSGWEEATIDFITLTIPKNWQPTPPDEELVGWNQGDPSDPDVAFGIINSVDIENQLNYLTIERESEKIINNVPFRFLEGQIPDSNIKIWLLLAKNPVHTEKTYGFMAGSRNFLWPEAEPVFNQILESIKITFPETGVILNIPKQPVMPGTELNIEFRGVPGNPKDWIGLYYSSASDRDYLSWKYLDGKTSGTITFSAPKEEGEYNLRIFENDGMTLLGKSTVFLVKKSTVQSKLQLEKDSFFPGEEIKLLFFAPPKLESSAWIGIIPSDIPHGDENVNDQHELTYQYLSGQTQGEMVFTAPSEPGEYDFRMHDSDSNGKEITSVSFKVALPQPSLSLNNRVFTPGETLTITFSNATTNQRDWIGLYKKDASDRDYLTWQYTDGKKEGSPTFEAPSEPGEYDARFFINDGYTRLAISEPFTVVIQEPPVLSPSPLIGTLSPETGLVLYLPLDNDSQDMSGSGNHGVPTSTLIVPGKIGQAYDFNGIDSTVITPLDINPEKIPEMSVTCWAYPRSSNGRRQVWSQDDGGFDRSLLVENDGWSVFIGGSDWITGKSVDLKQWQFLAVIFTSTDVIFYKNGEKFSYGTAGGTGMISSNTFTLGDNPAGYSEFFDGLIDEVRVYNRALGDEEIQSLFTASSPPVHNDNLNSMATNDWISAQRGNLVFEVPLNWKPLETDSLNLGGWYNGEDPNFPDGVISIMKATSLDAAKEDLIFDQENSLIIDNKMAKFTEGHYVQNKVRARFYFFEKVTVEQENLLIFVAAKDSLWNSFLPIEKHFIESVRFTDKLM